MDTPRCKGTALPKMREMPIGMMTTFPLEQLPALRTASWYLSKHEGQFYKVNKGVDRVFVTRTF